MASVQLSPKFQIVIPRDIRRALALVPGQQLEARLLVPAITLFEVARVLLRQREPAAAETALGFMSRGRVLALDAAGLLRAAQASVQHQLAMADALIWQTAADHDAVLWTQDAGLAAAPGVRFQAKPA